MADSLGIAFDISSAQGTITPSKMDCIACILRMGYTGYGSNKPALDTKFETYYQQLSAIGKPLGVYYFTIAFTEAMVDAETAFVIKHLQGKKIEYPIFVDVEAQTHSSGWTNLTKAQRSKLVARWCDNIQKAGYYVGIYANKDWLTNKLDLNVIGGYDLWVAQYYSRCTFTKHSYGMWQYSSSAWNGKEHGVSSTGLDLSQVYYDYPTLIRSKGLNHLDDTTTTSTVETATSTPTASYSLENFRSDAMAVLGVNSLSEAFKVAPTISLLTNQHHALVTPLERYFTALGIYKNGIEADKGKTPSFGLGMKVATKNFQKNYVKSADKYCDGVLTSGGRTYKYLFGV